MGSIGTTLGALGIVGVFGFLIGLLTGAGAVSDSRNFSVQRCIAVHLTLEDCAKVNGWNK